MRFKIKRTKHLKSSCVPESRSWVKKKVSCIPWKQNWNCGGNWCHLRQGLGQDGTKTLSLPAQGNSDCSQCQLLFSHHFQPLGMTTLSNTELLGYSVVSKAEAVSSQAVVSLGGNSVQKWLRTDWLGAWLRENFSPPINCVQLNILYISYKRTFPLQNMSHTDLVRNSSYNPLLLFPFFPPLGFVFVCFGFSLGEELKNIPRRSYQDYCLQTEKLLLLYYWDHEPRSFYRFPQLLLA